MVKIRNIISGKFLSAEETVKRFPAIMYIVALTIFYIFNVFDTQKRYREILAIEKEISRLKVTATTTQTERIAITRETYIIEQVEKRHLNLDETVTPPKTIRYE